MRLADPAPVACAACQQPAGVHEPRLRFVDFEAAWDGPVFTREGERPEEFTPIPIDDLVLCEECVSRAAEILGYEHGEKMREKVKEKDARIRGLESEVKDKDKAISDLQYSVGVVIDHPVHRGKGAPQVRGPASHDEDVKTVRSRRRTAAKISKAQKEKVA